jgi:CRISPR-associated protein Cas5d
MKGFWLEVTGPFACFTRPEMKVERVSYDMITPSAGRAIFEAVLWKPAISWRVKKIEILRPIQWVSIRRNEIGKTCSAGVKNIFIEDSRQQKAGLILRDVKYRLFGEFTFIPPEKRGQRNNPVPEWLIDGDDAALLPPPAATPDESEAKYAAMFERRARKGQHFHQPYLGCREFAADVRLVDRAIVAEPTIAFSADLGFMLYDLDFTDPRNIVPMFFRARIDNGVVNVPEPESPEVRR